MIELTLSDIIPGAMVLIVAGVWLGKTLENRKITKFLAKHKLTTIWFPQEILPTGEEIAKKFHFKKIVKPVADKLTKEYNKGLFYTKCDVHEACNEIIMDRKFKLDRKIVKHLNDLGMRDREAKKVMVIMARDMVVERMKWRENGNT